MFLCLKIIPKIKSFSLLQRKFAYQRQKKILGKRNSDFNLDTTFMPMEDNHMKNGQLKSGYNLQITTNS
jgi:hypothetical protein